MLIGLTGRMKSGKTTFAKMVEEVSSFERVSFGGKLREELADRGIDAYGDKDKVVSCKGLIEIYGYLTAGELKDYSCTLRRILQLWGTEYRRGQDPNYWIEALFLSLDPSKDYIIDDVRFPNEADMIYTLGGFNILLTHPRSPINKHDSEAQINYCRHSISYTQPEDITYDMMKSTVIDLITQLEEIREGELDEEIVS